MISERNSREIDRARNKIWLKLVEPVIFICTISVSYIYDFQYNDDTSLFNDKLIDVCSIFIGIFIGCLYLFDRFKNSQIYQDFLTFCRILLYLNITIIAYSFIIILVNPILTESYKISNSHFVFNLKLKVLLFSVYIALFNVVIYRMIRFINMVLIILKSSTDNS